MNCGEASGAHFLPVWHEFCGKNDSARTVGGARLLYCLYHGMPIAIVEKMGQTLQCQICDELATVHLTQIIQSKIHKVHLCENCALEKGVTDPEGISLEDLFSKAGLTADITLTEGNLVCKQCGLSTRDFRKNGRLGCQSCYSQLWGVIRPMLEGMHKEVSHRGKIPRRALERISADRELEQLGAKLQLAIEEERYEDAASLRDQIRHLENA